MKNFYFTRVSKKFYQGYTLIELLAIIVILAIIAIIATPIINSIMEDVRREAFTRSVEFAMSQYDFVRQTSSTVTEIDANSEELKLQNNDFISGSIVTDEENQAKALYVSDGRYCAVGVLGKIRVTKGECIIDESAPEFEIEKIVSIDKSQLTLRINALDEGMGLHDIPYSFDNRETWQQETDKIVTNTYNGTILVRDMANNTKNIDYSISKLTIDGNTGIWNGLNSTSIYWLEKDEEMNLPEPIKIGHDFTEWIKVGNGIVNGTTFRMQTEETTLTANWGTSTYTVTLNNQSATTAGTTSVTATYDSEMPSITIPTRTGYTFVGYYTATGGGGTRYYLSAGTSARTWNKTSATTLYAYWVKTTDTYAFNKGVHTFIALSTGNYKLEVWGAQGGNATDNNGTYAGGYGAYASGIVKLNVNEVLKIYVGGSGTSTKWTGVSGGNSGYNGGASGSYEDSLVGDFANKNAQAGGGGATDIRFGGTELVNRIIVAGGGGGATAHNLSQYSFYRCAGGSGGGLKGYDGTCISAGNLTVTGGSQTSGGISVTSSKPLFRVASFGLGGGNTSVCACCGGTPSCQYNISGGGGGYYGGGSGFFGPGGGGSSYISGHNGCNSVNASGTHTGNKDHYSGKVLSNTVMIDGQGYSWTNVKGALQAMPNPSGGYYASKTGRVNDGYARITYVGE